MVKNRGNTAVNGVAAAKTKQKVKSDQSAIEAMKKKNAADLAREEDLAEEEEEEDEEEDEVEEEMDEEMEEISEDQEVSFDEPQEVSYDSEDDEVDFEDETEVITEGEDDEAEPISRNSPDFWAIRLNKQNLVHKWQVNGAAALDETDVNKDPDFVELSLEISQVSIDHRTAQDELQTVEVSTKGSNKWFTIAFLSSKWPATPSRLVFSPADRPVSFRLAAGNGPVTLVGRLIRRVNELPAADARELNAADLTPKPENEVEDAGEDSEEIEETEEVEEPEEEDIEESLEASDEESGTLVKRQSRKPTGKKQESGSPKRGRPQKRTRQSPQKAEILPPQKRSRNVKSKTGR